MRRGFGPSAALGGAQDDSMATGGLARARDLLASLHPPAEVVAPLPPPIKVHLVIPWVNLLGLYEFSYLTNPLTSSCYPIPVFFQKQRAEAKGILSFLCLRPELFHAISGLQQAFVLEPQSLALSIEIIGCMTKDDDPDVLIYSTFPDEKFALKKDDVAITLAGVEGFGEPQVRFHTAPPADLFGFCIYYQHHCHPQPLLGAVLPHYYLGEFDVGKREALLVYARQFPRDKTLHVFWDMDYGLVDTGASFWHGATMPVGSNIALAVEIQRAHPNTKHHLMTSRYSLASVIDVLITAVTGIGYPKALENCLPIEYSMMIREFDGLKHSDDDVPIKRKRLLECLAEFADLFKPGEPMAGEHWHDFHQQLQGVIQSKPFHYLKASYNSAADEYRVKALFEGKMSAAGFTEAQLIIAPQRSYIRSFTDLTHVSMSTKSQRIAEYRQALEVPDDEKSFFIDDSLDHVTRAESELGEKVMAVRSKVPGCAEPFDEMAFWIAGIRERLLAPPSYAAAAVPLAAASVAPASAVFAPWVDPAAEASPTADAPEVLAATTVSLASV